MKRFFTAFGITFCSGMILSWLIIIVYPSGNPAKLGESLGVLSFFIALIYAMQGKKPKGRENGEDRESRKERDAEYWKSLSREELIEKAESVLLDDTEVKYEKGLCGAVRIFAGDTAVYAAFSVPIRYVPLDSGAYYQARVDLTADMVSYESLSNPEDYDGEKSFYRQTEKDRAALSFVFDSLRNDENFSEFSSGNVPDGITLTVMEHEEHYGISAAAETVEYGAEIDKQTGEVKEFYSALISLPPERAQKAVEIKRE